MIRNTKNFKGLSLKQIKTYVIAAFMSLFAMDAVAYMSTEESNPYEAAYEAEINLESWMTTSFELPVEEGPTTFAFDPTAYEMVIESELSMEDWMIEPFEVALIETPAMESENCNTAP